MQEGMYTCIMYCICLYRGRAQIGPGQEPLESNRGHSLGYK